MLTATISSILFFLKIKIKSFLTTSRCSSVFFNASEPLIFSSFSKDNKKKNQEELSKKDNSKPEEKIKELEDKITRTLAEMENQRRRFEKEKEDAFEDGGFSFARESLALIDNLERAKESIQNDSEIKDNKILKKAVNHLEIIKKDLLSIFKKNNIEKIESINKKLDPNLHQAMIEIENNEKESGTIIQEIQKGFIMKDRLLRPALVGVAKSSNKKEKTKNFKENEENKDKNKENNEQ